jgi:hypothetical protein
LQGTAKNSISGGMRGSEDREIANVSPIAVTAKRCMANDVILLVPRREGNVPGTATTHQPVRLQEMADSDENVGRGPK